MNLFAGGEEAVRRIAADPTYRAGSQISLSVTEAPLDEVVQVECRVGAPWLCHYHLTRAHHLCEGEAHEALFLEGDPEEDEVGDGPRMERSKVAPLVAALGGAMRQRSGLSEARARFEVAGSWRRGSPTVGDLDLLVGSRITDRVLPRGFLLRSGGPARVHGTFLRRLKVDVWAVPDGSWGPFLWFATGPHDLNVAMRSIAMRRGLKLNQYGLWTRDGKRRIDDGSEEGVADALGLPWIDPDERDDWRARW